MIQIAPTITPAKSEREKSPAVGSVTPSVGSRQEADAVSQLRMHLAQLEDLHGRLRFVMSDVSTVLKKKL